MKNTSWTKQLEKQRQNEHPRSERWVLNLISIWKIDHREPFTLFFTKNCCCFSFSEFYHLDTNTDCSLPEPIKSASVPCVNANNIDNKGNWQQDQLNNNWQIIPAQHLLFKIHNYYMGLLFTYWSPHIKK